jgi:hypothetical protein
MVLLILIGRRDQIGAGKRKEERKTQLRRRQSDFANPDRSVTFVGFDQSHQKQKLVNSFFVDCSPRVKAFFGYYAVRMLRGSRLLVQLPCELGLVSVGPCSGELVGAEPAVRIVWTVQVAVDSPVLDEHLGLEEGIEAVAIEELVA